MQPEELKEYEEFLKKKDEIIKKIQDEKREIKDKTYQVFDDIEKAIKESNVEEAVQRRDIEKNQHLPNIFASIMATLWGLLTFDKERMKESYVLPGIKRKMLLYSIFSVLIALALLFNYFFAGKDISLLVIAGFLIILGPFAMLALITMLAYLIQAFFFFFSGLKKSRELENVLSYLPPVLGLIILLNSIIRVPAVFYVLMLAFAIWGVVVLVKASSMIFNIKAWESAVSVFAFFIFIIAVWFAFHILMAQLEWKHLFSLG
ncbi:MAG TPA: YIP1 family protein [Candidatus Woesearchaeota archaeon]|nr:YIP1 family protein [Candidatus Woesearchaeota archaeon]